MEPPKMMGIDFGDLNSKLMAVNDEAEEQA